MANLTQISPAPSPAPPPRGGGLGEKIYNAFVAGIVAAANVLLAPFSSMLQHFVEATLEKLESELLEIIRPFLLDIRNEPDMPEGIKRRIDDILNPRHPAWLLAALPFLFAAILPIIQMIVPIVGVRINLLLSRIFKPFRLPFDVIWRAGRIDPGIEKITRGDLLDQGWDDRRIELAVAASERRLDIGDIGQLVLRGEMSAAKAIDELWQAGWKREHAQEALKLLQIIPGPGDLISMAVREAWDENFARIAGTDEGLPAEFVSWAGKAGLGPDWCKRYWRAHWQLPSAQMGMEMLHRNVIDDAAFDALLKALDISPGWRDKLKAISYNVPTRVDLRRAFRDGVISRAEVHGGYLDAGYDEKWAEILTRWTEIAYAPEEKEISISDVRGALDRGMLNEAEASDYLKSLDVGAEAIGFYIAQARFKRAQHLKEVRVSAIEKKFISGKFDRPDAASALTALSLAASEIDISLDAWSAARDAKVRQPSEAQLRGFYLDDIISAEIFRRELDELGYDDDAIALYVRSADADKERQAKDASEKAQAEQERLAKAEKATAYQKIVADLNIKIAEQRQAIANAQAALNAGLSDKQIRDAEDKIDQIAAESASERAQIASFSAQRTAATNALNAKISAALRNRIDEEIGAAQTEIGALNRQIASANTQIAEAKLALLSAATDEEKAALKESVAERQLAAAQFRELIAAQQLKTTEARNQLRALITDVERQTLEAAIRDADASIKKSQSAIADYAEQAELLKNKISASLASEQRAALAQSISDAHKRIAELQVKRAEARVED